MMNELLAVSDPDGLVFVRDLHGTAQHRKMDHLVCFLPGLLAWGLTPTPLVKIPVVRRGIWLWQKR